jgi:hypothetical protein
MNATQIADIYQGHDQKDREEKFAQLLTKVEPTLVKLEVPAPGPAQAAAKSSGASS